MQLEHAIGKRQSQNKIFLPVLMHVTKKESCSLAKSNLESLTNSVFNDSVTVFTCQLFYKSLDLMLSQCNKVSCNYCNCFFFSFLMVTYTCTLFPIPWLFHDALTGLLFHQVYNAVSEAISNVGEFVKSPQAGDGEGSHDIVQTIQSLLQVHSVF